MGQVHNDFVPDRLLCSFLVESCSEFASTAYFRLGSIMLQMWSQCSFCLGEKRAERVLKMPFCVLRREQSMFGIHLFGRSLLLPLVRGVG